MFGKLFDIGKKSEPQIEEKKPIVFAQSIVVKPTVKRSPKNDSLTALSNLLDELENVNNPKVDSLRKLYLHLQTNDDKANLVAYLKQPIPPKKKKKTIKLNKI